MAAEVWRGLEDLSAILVTVLTSELEAQPQLTALIQQRTPTSELRSPIHPISLLAQHLIILHEQTVILSLLVLELLPHTLHRLYTLI